MTEDVKNQLNRGRIFLKKYNLSKTHKLVYVDRRNAKTRTHKPFFTIMKMDRQGHTHRIMSAESVDKLMRQFIGNNKQFLRDWCNTRSNLPTHYRLDIKYKIILESVKELGITQYKIKKITDDRVDIGIGRCFGFYEKLLSSFVLCDRSLEITDFFGFIKLRDNELAQALEETYNNKLNQYE